MSIATIAILANFSAAASVAGETVTFQRGNLSVNVTAVPGKTQLYSDDGAGARIEAVADDFRVRAADLILGGAVVIPQSLDRIILTLNGQILAYEVMAEKPFDPCDPQGLTIRLHTKQVGAITP